MVKYSSTAAVLEEGGSKTSKKIVGILSLTETKPRWTDQGFQVSYSYLGNVKGGGGCIAQR